MPAVNLEILRAEIRELFKRSQDLEQFQTRLRSLLERYGNQSYRAGAMVPSFRKIQRYHVSPQVLNELQQEFRGFSQVQPNQSLILSRMLWKDRFYECRSLAISILGEIPLTQHDQILDCISEWAQPEEDPLLLGELFERGTNRLRREALNDWLKRIQDWYDDIHPGYMLVSLRAVIPLINDPEFINLPFIFKLVSYPLISGAKDLQGILEEILARLAKRVPVETGFFLRQVLSQTISRDTLPLIRKTLPHLDAETRRSVRNIISALTG